MTEAHSAAFDVAKGIECPRCGYDQRGVVEAWDTLCPAEGHCSECGLGWRWSDLIRGSYNGPRWCIEHGSGREIARRTIRTICRIARPTRFWTELQMQHSMRLLRICVPLPLTAIALYVLFAIGIAFQAWRGANATAAPLSFRVLTGAYAGLLPFSDSPPSWYVTPNYQTWSRATGVLRPPVPFDFAMRSLHDSVYLPTLESVRSGIGSGRLEMIQGGIWILDVWVMFAGLIALVVPLGFLAIPISRRQARVKWKHLARIALYSLMPCFAFLLYQCALLGTWPYLSFLRPLQGPLHSGMFFACVLMPPFLFVWWRSAIHHYLRMPNASAMAVGIVLIAVLIGTLGVFGPVLLLALYLD
jgi:hypothetical protein